MKFGVAQVVFSLKNVKENSCGGQSNSCGGRKCLEVLGLVDFVGSFQVLHGFWAVSCLESFERVRRVGGN